MPALGDKFLVTLVGKMAGQVCLTTHHLQLYEITGAPTEQDIADAINADFDAAASVNATMVSCTPPQYKMEEMWVQKIDPVRMRKRVYAVNRTGTFASVGASANTAGVISREGTLTGRSHQGRIHVPIGTDEQASVAGRLVAGLITKLNLHADQIKGNINLAGGIGKVYFVLNNGVGAGAVTLIVNAVAQTTTRVMRRRTVGVGI